MNKGFWQVAECQTSSKRTGEHEIVDDYINDSVKDYWEGYYESDDPLGAATPHESRRLNEEAHRNK